MGQLLQLPLFYSCREPDSVISNQNEVPFSSESTPYFIPWAFKIVLTMERPIPVPMRRPLWCWLRW